MENPFRVHITNENDFLYERYNKISDVLPSSGFYTLVAIFTILKKYNWQDIECRYILDNVSITNFFGFVSDI